MTPTIPPVADDEAMRIASIIERVEAATGPDRDVDLDIWRLTDPRAGEIEAAGKVPLTWLHCYTASLDAAMTLVPRWALPNMRHDSDRMLFVCQLENGLGRPFRGYAGHGQSYALALCAAALRARDFQSEASDGQ